MRAPRVVHDTFVGRFAPEQGEARGRESLQQTAQQPDGAASRWRTLDFSFCVYTCACVTPTRIARASRMSSDDQRATTETSDSRELPTVPSKLLLATSTRNFSLSFSILYASVPHASFILIESFAHCLPLSCASPFSLFRSFYRTPSLLLSLPCTKVSLMYSRPSEAPAGYHRNPEHEFARDLPNGTRFQGVQEDPN